MARGQCGGDSRRDRAGVARWRRWHAVDDNERHVDVSFFTNALGKFQGLVNRTLFGRGDENRGRRIGVGKHLDHPIGLFAQHADLGQRADRSRCGELARDVTRTLGIDNDEVVMVRTYLVADLADGEDLLHAGSGIGHEVERLGQDADTRHEWDPHVEADVFTQCLFGFVHRRRKVRM